MSGFYENINKSPLSGSCCYHSRDSHTIPGMTSGLPPSKQAQKETNLAAVAQQPKSSTQQHWTTLNS